MRTFTKNFDTYIARAFFESFTNDPSNHYYMFAAKSTPYDTSPNLPTIGRGVTSSFYDIQKDIIFGKKLTLEDISYMIKKTIHVSGTVYDQYDDKDDNLFDKNFFVFTEEGGYYSLFKCISNNYGAESVDKPLYSRTTYSDRYYQTGDGYIWKLMTRISSSKFEKFETDNYAPLEHIGEISSFAVDGSIDNIVVEEIGANYNSFAYGSIKSVSYANNARKLVIQTDTEKDIYEMPIAETSGSYYTGSNVYIWAFTPTQAANTEFVVNTILTQDYGAVSSNPDVNLLGTVYTYTESESVIRVARDSEFNISYADFSSGDVFVLASQTTAEGVQIISQEIVKASLGLGDFAGVYAYPGRLLADISGAGGIESYDAYLLANYLTYGSTGTPATDTYISTIFIPFLYASSTLKKYAPIAISGVTGLQIVLVPELSANNSFYVGSSFYVRGGTGSGQLKTITGYDIIGNDRVITVDTAFTTSLDQTSRYEIAPRVIIDGDGTGASAITLSTLQGGGTLTKGIRKIEMVDGGSGYSYANVTVSGNTGIIDTTTGLTAVANTAVARAIISPNGGHGADIINEMYATGISFSTNFQSTDHPVENDYNMYGVIVNPKFNKKEVLTLSGSTDFVSLQSQLNSSATGELLVTQADTGASAMMYDIDSPNILIRSIQGDFKDTDALLELNYLQIGTTSNIVNNTSLNVTSKFDNRTALGVTFAASGSSFDEDEMVTSTTSGTTAYVHSQDVPNNILYVTGVRGNFVLGETITGDSGLSAVINSITEPELDKNTGEILYIETTEQISRSSSQTETLKIVTNF